MLDLFPNISPTTATIVGAILSMGFAANMHFFKWLGKKFEKLTEKIEGLGQEHRTQLDIHEGRDQQRHEENLSRFQDLNVALARLEENVEAQKTTYQSRPGSTTEVS